jgi:hypothetical protein
MKIKEADMLSANKPPCAGTNNLVTTLFTATYGFYVAPFFLTNVPKEDYF